MSWGTDGNVAQWEKQVGAKNMGVGADPDLGQRQARDELRRDAVVGRVHHEVVEAPEGGRAVPDFLHSPQALKAWYKATGRVPRRQAVPRVAVKDPIAKQLLKLDQSPVSVWPENFVPPQVDQNADLAGGEMITSGSGSPADVVKLWKTPALAVEEPAPGRVP